MQGPSVIFHAARTAAINARTFAASFFPGADSTPLETSTANGFTFFTASATFSGANRTLTKPICGTTLSPCMR